jgi:glycosyltransferase involved in cell wall biosynthesis
MRLVINGRFLAQPVTGVQRYAREVVAALDQHLDRWPGWSVEMLVPPGIQIPSYKRIAVRCVGRLHGHAWEQLELPRHHRGDVLFCPANTAPIATLLSHRATVVTVHDLSYRYFPDAYTRAFRLLYNTVIPVVMRRAAGIITVSHAERAQILRYYPAAAERLAVVPNGGAPAITGTASTELEALRPYLLYVGSFSRRKNFDGVLVTAGRLLEERPELRMVFVGGTPEVFRQVEQDAQPHPRMIFAGQINDPEALLPYYRSAEALLFPSFYESSGLPPVEAMACGCPVVASEIPALVERCGSAALYCNPKDNEEIHRQVVRLLDDPVLRRFLVAEGLQRCQDFTWESCATQTMERIIEAASLKTKWSGTSASTANISTMP